MKYNERELALLKRRIEEYETDLLINSKSFIIEGFMIDDLNLKSNDLLIYAFIYSSDNEYTINQICEIMHIPISTTKRSLSFLLKKDLILKRKKRIIVIIV